MYQSIHHFIYAYNNTPTLFIANTCQQKDILKLPGPKEQKMLNMRKIEGGTLEGSTEILFQCLEGKYVIGSHNYSTHFSLPCTSLADQNRTPSIPHCIDIPNTTMKTLIPSTATMSTGIPGNKRLDH